MMVETRLTFSKTFPPGTTDVSFARYTLRPIPSTEPGRSEAVLQFDNTYRDANGSSHPEEELDTVSRLLSLAFGALVERRGIRIEAIDIPAAQKPTAYPEFSGTLGLLEKAQNTVAAVLALDADLARQFLRASRAYALGISFIPSDPTFAFFLLGVAVECLSSQPEVIPATVLPTESKCERFCHFLTTFLPNEHRGDDESDVELFRELLKTIYYSHRSAFVHGGREVSHATILADQAQSSYLKHELDGNEIRTPGIGWFARTVRRALLGWTKTVSTSRSDPDLLSRLAMEKAGLKLKVKKPIQKGQPVTLADIDYR